MLCFQVVFCFFEFLDMLFWVPKLKEIVTYLGERLLEEICQLEDLQ